MKFLPPSLKNDFPLQIAFICLIGFAVAWLGSFPPRAGDGMEYIAMTQNMAKLGLPALSPDELTRFHEWGDAMPNRGMAGMRIIFPSLVGNDGRQDFPHFWFYSLLAVPFWWFCQLVSLNVLHAFTLLNMMLLAIATRVALKVFHPVSVLLVIGSPILWWLNKGHTEVFTYACVILAVSALVRNRFLWAAFSLALASTQNIPWLLPVIGLQVLYLAQSLFQRRSIRLQDIAGLVTVNAVALLHPLYYWLRLGAITPQFSSRAAGVSQKVDWTTYWAILLDPEIGLLGHWIIPVLLVLCIGFTLLIPQSIEWIFRLFHKSRKEGDPQDISPALVGASFGTIPVILWLLFAFSRTSNFNHGGTVDLSRYALWLMPLALPYFDMLWQKLGWKTPMTSTGPLQVHSKATLRRVVGGGAIVLLIFYSITFSPSVREQYLEPTLFSKWFYTALPCLYQPIPEVFVERRLNREVYAAEYIAATPSCSLSFSRLGLLPGHCQYTAAEIEQVKANVAQGKLDNWIVRPGSLGRCPSRVIGLSSSSSISNLSLESANLLDPSSLIFFQAVSGLGGVENNARQPMRWGLNQETNFVFKTSQSRAFELIMQVDNPIPEQSLTVKVNDKLAKRLNLPELGPSALIRLPFDSNAGLNHIALFYEKPVSPESYPDLAPRTLGFTRLEIMPVANQSS